MRAETLWNSGKGLVAGRGHLSFSGISVMSTAWRTRPRLRGRERECKGLQLHLPSHLLLGSCPKNRFHSLKQTWILTQTRWKANTPHHFGSKMSTNSKQAESTTSATLPSDGLGRTPRRQALVCTLPLKTGFMWVSALLMSLRFWLLAAAADASPRGHSDSDRDSVPSQVPASRLMVRIWGTPPGVMRTLTIYPQPGDLPGSYCALSRYLPSWTRLGHSPQASELSTVHAGT